MTAEATASAGASLTSQWHAIDWQAARGHVRRLQMRIAKATRQVAGSSEMAFVMA